MPTFFSCWEKFRLIGGPVDHRIYFARAKYFDETSKTCLKCDTILEYDTTSQKKTTVPPPPTPAAAGFTITVNGKKVQ